VASAFGRKEEDEMTDIRRVALASLAVAALTTTPAAQQAPQPATTLPTEKPAAAVVPGTVSCPAPAPPATMPARMFNAPAGLLMVPVQSTKVADFEKFLGYVREALASTTDATVRKQAAGWKFFKVAEPGPNQDVLFAFLLDPAVPCVDYAFSPILAAAIPDAAKLSEVWKLYTGSAKNGGTLMNLVPVGAAAAASAPTAGK
jgi:hypothetical protein